MAASKSSDATIASILWMLGALCVAPALFMLGGTAWHEGHPSLFHIIDSFRDTKRMAVLFTNSLVVTAGTVCIALLLGLPAGFLCFRTNMPFRRTVIFACLLAACIPVYITATCWMALFGMHFWLYSAWGASWISGVAYAPFVTLITGICFATGDRELEDVTSLDTGRVGVFRHVTLPAGSWGIAAAAATVAILSLWDITITDILMIRTFGEEVFTQFQLGAGPWNAAAISLPVIAVQLLLWLIVWRTLRGRGETALWSSARQPATIKLGHGRWVFALATLMCVAVFFILPVFALLNAVGTPGNLVTAWHTAHDELLTSLELSSIAATACATLATAAAWAIVRTRYSRWVVVAGMFLLLAVPAPVVGIGLIKLLNHQGLSGMIYDSTAGLVLAYVIRTLPFAILAILPAIRSIPREMEESAAIDGAGWLKRIVFIVVPQARKAILAGWLIVFILSLSEMGASFLVVPPGNTTLSIRFFTLIHYGVYPDAAGICLILLGVVGLAAAGIAAICQFTFNRNLGVDKKRSNTET